jgi:hypothetical protein
MFVIDEDCKFKRTVEVKKPIDGGFKLEKLDVTYKALPVDSSTEITKAGGDKALLRACVVDLAIGDGQGNTLPFNSELLERAMNVPYVLTALTGGYLRAIAGAAEKN